MNAEIEDFQKKISNNELKRLVGIEGRFAFIQNELTAVKRLQIEQKDCADVNSNLFFLSLNWRFRLVFTHSTTKI